MARKSASGKYVLTAGEIGGYTVCPEAWRIWATTSVKTLVSEKSKTGRKLHSEWAGTFEEITSLSRYTKHLLLLLAMALLAWMIR